MTATFQPLHVSPGALDFARAQDELRASVLTSFGVPARLLADSMQAFASGVAVALGQFARFLDATREQMTRWVRDTGVLRLLTRSLPKQLHRRIAALLRKGSGRTARLRKKRADAVREAQRLFRAYFGL